jgi:hypothetical protein
VQYSPTKLGDYSVTWKPKYVGVEFTEGQQPDEMEKMGIGCHWVFQPK